MTEHHANKKLTASLLHDLAHAAPGESRSVLAAHCRPDTTFEIFHPFNTLHGVDEAAEGFFEPLRAAFPDHEHRIGLAIAGSYEGREVTSTLGHICGTFDQPWVGIPPTNGLTYLRFGTHAIVSGGRISKMYILLDVPDVMRQAGYYPFRVMPGSAEQWPLPPIDTDATVEQADPVAGAKTMRIVSEMQNGLGQGADFAEHVAASVHSPHWHDHMNWFGPAGIGSTRGQRGFNDYHKALFIQAFPDRSGYSRVEGGPEDAPGHYIEVGDGRYAVTGGWPSLHGTHTGGQWLGLPPTGRHVEMRVADWYRLDDDDKIIDNWVMIDVLHILQQMGYDVLDDLTYISDPAKPRWI